MEHAAREALRLLGTPDGISWSSGSRKRSTIALKDGRARALVPILANAAEQRTAATSAKAQSADDFALFEALTKAWSETSAEQPQTTANEANGLSTPDSPACWLLERVECTGFGGINGPSTPAPFILEISSESTCFHGGNGSGKTSLVSAIAWALTGQRIDDSEGLSFAANRPAPVYAKDDPDRQIGMWPPVTTYPSSQSGYATPPATSVSLTFRREGAEQRASVTRTYSSTAEGFSVVEWDRELECLRGYLDIAVEMPLRIAFLRLGQESQLNDLVAALTGLELLAGIGDLVATLARADRPFLNTPKQADHNATKSHAVGHIDRAIAAADNLRATLTPFRTLEDFLDSDLEVELLKLADGLTKSVTADLKELADHVASTVDFATPSGQAAVTNAIAAAVSLRRGRVLAAV